MKNLFESVLTSDWISKVLPERLSPVTKKTPWYRQLPTTHVPSWVPVVLVAPLALLVAWKGIRKLRARESSPDQT